MGKSLHPDGDPHATTSHGYADGHANLGLADPATNQHTGWRHSNQYPGTHTHSVAHVHTLAHADDLAHADSVVYGHTLGHAHAEAHTFYSNALANIHALGYANAARKHEYAHADRYSLWPHANSTPLGNEHAGTHAYPVAHTNAVAHADTLADSHADTNVHALADGDRITHSHRGSSRAPVAFSTQPHTTDGRHRAS